MGIQNKNPYHIGDEKLNSQCEEINNTKTCSPVPDNQTGFWANPMRPGAHLLGPDVYVLSRQKCLVGMDIPHTKKQEPTAPPPGSWQCFCGRVNSRNFCTECGKKRP